MPFRSEDAPTGFRTLEEALNVARTSQDLRNLVIPFVKPRPTAKHELIRVMLQHLLDVKELQKLWAQLSKSEQTILSHVVYAANAPLELDRVLAEYGIDIDDLSMSKSNQWAMDGFYSEERGAPESKLRYFLYGGWLPDDLRGLLKTFVPKPASYQVRSFEQVPPRDQLPIQKILEAAPGFPTEVRLLEHASALVAQHELINVLRLVDAGRVAVSDKTHKPSAAAMKAVESVLEGVDYFTGERDEPDEEPPGPIRPFAWPMILQATKLAEVSQGKLRLTKAGQMALGKPAAETLKSIWPKWLESSLFDELSRIEAIKGQGSRGGQLLSRTAPRREAIARGLQGMPVGRWVTVDELDRYRTAHRLDFDVTRTAEGLWKLYLLDPEYGSFGYSGGGYLPADRYELCILFEYVATMGLIDIAYVHPSLGRTDYADQWGADDLLFLSRYDGLAAFRLNPLGAYVLGLSPHYEAPAVRPGTALKVLPNLEIATLEPTLPVTDRLVLDAYAEPVSERVWRLTRSKLLTAIEEHRSVGDFRTFLRAASQGDLPETVSRFLDDIEERSTRLRDTGAARLIDCGDAALAKLIASDTRLRKLCVLAGEQSVAVPEKSLAAFHRGLKELGYVVANAEK